MFRRFIYFILLFIFIIYSLAIARIDIGEEIFIKSSFYDNITDYDDSIEDRHSYIHQRIRFYLEGEIQKDIIARLTMQSIGLWGGEKSDGTVEIENYEYPNFTPWIEHSYIKLVNVYESRLIGPIDIIIGKQPFKYDDGYVIDDDNQGIFAFRVTSPFPLHTNLDIFTAKIRDRDGEGLTGKDFDVRGLYLKYNEIKNITPKLYYISESDKTREVFIDGESRKTFLGIRIDGKTEEDLYYKGEFIKQGGKVSRDDPKDNFNYNAYAYILGISMQTFSSKFGKTKIRLEHAKGTGDKAEGDFKQNLTKGAFTPTLTSRSKELGETYYGEIFSQMLPGLSNKSIILVGFDFNPRKKLHIGIDYLRLSRSIPEGLYGEEIDMFTYTEFANSIGIRFVYALMRPGKALNEQGSNLRNTILEMGYKF